MHGGQAYGAQAVLSAAHQKATGTTVRDHDWASKDQAARILRELGFRVLAGDDPEAVVPVTGAWRETSEVGPEATREAWAVAARERLLEAARRYRATVPPQELAIEVQRRSGIRTRQLWHHWLDEVLGLVALDSARLEEPLLVSLCADDAGRVTDGYAVAVLAAAGVRPENPNAHAAKERLECYRHFDAVGLPADGGICRTAQGGGGAQGQEDRHAASTGGEEADQAGRPPTGDLPDVLHGYPTLRRLRQLRLAPDCRWLRKARWRLSRNRRLTGEVLAGFRDGPGGPPGPKLDRRWAGWGDRGIGSPWRCGSDVPCSVRPRA